MPEKRTKVKSDEVKDDGTDTASHKRKIETVDLTGDDYENEQQLKRVARYPAYSDESLPTRPASSQLSSSQLRSDQVPWNSSQPSHYWNDREDWVDDDLTRDVTATEDFDDDIYEDYRLYGILDTKIVGVRYYNGRATVGEFVVVRREPRNPYDSNAIRIDNVVGDQIGHIPRGMAAKLAGLIDSKQLLVEGVLTGRKETYEAPIALKLFGTNDPVASAALKQQMQALRLPVTELTRAEREQKQKAKAMEEQRKAREKAAAAMRKGGGQVFDPEGPNRYANLMPPGGPDAESPPALDQLLSGTASFNPRDVQDAVNQFGAGEAVLSKMEMAEQPKAISTLLLPYQKQGLKWMLEHESPKHPEAGSKDMVQLWKRSKDAFLNIATSFAVTKAPELAKGGILADDMGLGKTLQIISLIMADPRRAHGQPTLIIAPLSVMSNWKQQAAAHIKKKDSLSILTYHGQDAKGTPEELRQNDLVITTYQTMAREIFPNGKEPRKVPTKDGLFSVKWRRIVLDEGHTIRNPNAKMSQAACALMADSRWILSGTPIVNSLKDLYSHIKFLGLSGGVCEFDIFNGTLIRPLKNGSDDARLLLQALMSSVSLRRTKDMKFIDLKLPKLEFHKYPIDFLPHEQERYDAFKQEARGMLEAAKAKKGDLNMTHLLEVLLRLRQTCNHWKMCGEERANKLLELIGEDGKSVDVMDPANRQALQDLLQIRIDSQEDCPICIEFFRNPVITACAHAFCTECIEKTIEVQQKCPMCRQHLADVSQLVRPAAGMGEGEADQAVDFDVDSSSSKIEALIKLLKASVGKGDKTVVFSQWTSFLDLVQAQLNEHGLVFTRLDGRMNAAQRDAAIETLNSEDDCKIMLASLGVCSVGLNLVAANQVILSDSWWAPAIEDQAVDRVHRLGQTRDCKVVRLIMKDSVEDEVLEIQAKKRKLASMAFGEKTVRRGRGEEQVQRWNDINRLLG